MPCFDGPHGVPYCKYNDSYWQKSNLRAKTFHSSSAVQLLCARLTTDDATIWTALTALWRTWSGFSARAASATSANHSQMCCLTPQNNYIHHNNSQQRRTQLKIKWLTAEKMLWICHGGNWSIMTLNSISQTWQKHKQVD